MSKERRIGRVGIAAAAISTAALGAAYAIENKPLEATIGPGECEVFLENNIRVCNYSNNNNYRVAQVDRYENDKWLPYDAYVLAPSETFAFQEPLRGLIVTEDNPEIHLRLAKPLKDATPYPTTTPTPTTDRLTA